MNATKLSIRPLQYRDLEPLARWAESEAEFTPTFPLFSFNQQIQQFRNWYGLLKFLSWFPNPLQHHFYGYIAELPEIAVPQGFIQIAPFNHSRSTWRVERVIVPPQGLEPAVGDRKDIGTQLLRHSLESVWQARTWVLEVNINAKDHLALYRQNGFQPLAQLTYWALSPQRLLEIAHQDADLPNLLPTSNADAQLLYQLDCMAMPPLLRQVFDRHVDDFKQPILTGLWSKFQSWCSPRQVSSGYVFEPQRKAAIAYYKLFLCKNGSAPHQAELIVHPAYTWLYPKLLAQMAKMVQMYPAQSLELISADYQHEREEYLEKFGAEPFDRSLLMSRSVWHKIKEVKPEGLHLSEVLQGLQSVPRTPIPSRMSFQTPVPPPPQDTKASDSSKQPSTD